MAGSRPPRWELLWHGTNEAPKGFDKAHPAIDLLRKKQFLLTRSFTNEEIVSPNFQSEVIKTFKAMRPFFDYMSEVLNTDLNGEYLNK